MRTKLCLVLFAFLIAVLTVNAQVYIDPEYELEAQMFAYKMETAPTIDAVGADWENIPWSNAYNNDRDHNGDGMQDPLPARTDFQGRFKAAWVDGSNVVYFLFETRDDQLYVADSVRGSHRDSYKIRLDPYDEELAGEPGEGHHSFNIGFQPGNAQHISWEGADDAMPEYTAAVKVDSSVYPIKTVLEIAITLPADVTLSKDYAMGFWMLFDDNDQEDDSYNSKNASLTLWPPLYCMVTNGRVGVDGWWSDDYYWGNLVCADMPAVHEVNGGGTGTIQAAIDGASAGDIIKVGPGVYHENIVINQPWIQIVGTLTDTDTTVIMPTVPADPALTVADNNAGRGVVIKNLCFNGYQADNGEVITSVMGVSVNSSEVKVLNNVFYSFDTPLSSTNGSYNLVMEDNDFYGNNGSVDFNGPNAIFRYNRVIENAPNGYGVSVKGLAADNIIDIAHNEISNVRQCGIGWGGEGCFFTIHHNLVYRSFEERTTPTREMDDGIENQEDGASTSYFYNNTIIGWDSDGAQLNGPSNFYGRNNLIAYNDGYAYDFRGEPGALDIDYGLSYENGKGAYDEAFASSVGANMIGSDPVFNDELEDDYTLMDSSPAVNAGELEPFGFKTQYYGATPDIGYFEYGTPEVTPTAINDQSTQPMMKKAALSQNYPNPFNPTTVISYNLKESYQVSLKIYDIIGREVETLVDQRQDAGKHSVEWNAENAPTGIYFYRLETKDYSDVKKMMFIK